MPDQAHEEDEAVASKETRGKMREFISAWHTATGDEQARILGDLVFNWRGDNAAGGLPVYSHNPLPSDFARTITGLASREGKQAVLEEAVAKLDPTVRTSVVRQIHDWTQHRDQTLHEHGEELWDVERGPTVEQALRDTPRVGTTSLREEVLAHEIGHIISDVMGLGERLSALPAGDRLQVGQELNRVFTGQRGLPGQFDGYARNPEEWIAEFFMLYLLVPERASSRRP